MTLLALIQREIRHRKLNFALSTGAVVLAVACLSGALALLDAHDRRTEEILAQKREETALRLRKLEDDVRKITKNLGFNILILPRDQNLADLYAQDFAAKDMPEAYAERLANANVVTINHLLPSLTQRVEWAEEKRTIILMGVRGEIPLLHRDPKQPILQPVAKGAIVLGYELHRTRGIQPGETILLAGRSFTVATCYAQRGSKDDITAWIDLGEAQEMLAKPGRINAILALECNCTQDRLHIVRQEIEGILPDTQVIERGTEATARAEARNRAASEATAALGAEEESRSLLRREIESFAGLIVPQIVFGCAVCVGFLALVNARERRAEVGILRAIGLGGRAILRVFLGRAVLVGLLGAVLGCPLGWASAALWRQSDAAAVPFDPVAALIVAALAPLVAALAACGPAYLAAHQDPANVLRER